MLSYAVSNNVIEIIEKECRRHPDIETGGILMGLTLAGCVTVTHATGPGIIWDSSPHHFSKDRNYVQEVLNILHEYSGVNYLGLWHKHPLTHPRPSHGDVLNAMEEIADEQIGLEQLLTPICLLLPNKVEIIPYIVYDNQAEQVRWTQVPHDSITDDRILGSQWYRTKGGNERLTGEINGLKDMGMEIEIREGPDKRYQIRVPVDNDGGTRTEMVFLCPDDYPVGAPSVAIIDGPSKQYKPFHSNTIDDWNITKYLRDVVSEYNADIQHQIQDPD